MLPKISVIIPVYNGASFILKTIESVLRQSYPAYEIIVVDDGSTDDTPVLLEALRDKIITRRIPNSGGPVIPRNAGIELARGDYLAFLDADDIWFKDKLKKEAAFILKYPDIGFFCCNYAIRRADQDFRMKDHFGLVSGSGQINFDEPLKADPFRLLLRLNFIGTPSMVLIKREVIDKVGKFRGDSISFAEDSDYWLRCAKVTNFVVLSEVLLYKRTHQEAMSVDPKTVPLSWKGTLEYTMREMEGYLKEHQLLGECKLALAVSYYDLGDCYFEEGRIRNAFKMYFTGLKQSHAFKNHILFTGKLCKKIIRLLTFGVINKKNITKILLYTQKAAGKNKT